MQYWWSQVLYLQFALAIRIKLPDLLKLSPSIESMGASHSTFVRSLPETALIIDDVERPLALARGAFYVQRILSTLISLPCCFPNASGIHCPTALGGLLRPRLLALHGEQLQWLVLPMMPGLDVRSGRARRCDLSPIRRMGMRYMQHMLLYTFTGQLRADLPFPPLRAA